MNATQSIPRKARNRKIPASRIEIQKKMRLREGVDSGEEERKSLKINTLLLDNQGSFHYLGINGADVFSSDAKKQ